MHVFVVQTTRLKQSNSKELERIELVVFGHKMNWRNQRNVELACSANPERVFLPLDRSGVSYFALGKGELRQIALCCNKSEKFCPLYYNVIVIVDGHFAAYALKIYITAERWGTRKVITIMGWADFCKCYEKLKKKLKKKNWKIKAPLLGLAKYIYFGTK